MFGVWMIFKSNKLSFFVWCWAVLRVMHASSNAKHDKTQPLPSTKNPTQTQPHLPLKIRLSISIAFKPHASLFDVARSPVPFVFHRALGFRGRWRAFARRVGHCDYFRHCCLLTDDSFSSDPQSVTSLKDKKLDNFDIYPIPQEGASSRKVTTYSEGHVWSSDSKSYWDIVVAGERCSWEEARIIFSPFHQGNRFYHQRSSL